MVGRRFSFVVGVIAVACGGESISIGADGGSSGTVQGGVGGESHVGGGGATAQGGASIGGNGAASIGGTAGASIGGAAAASIGGTGDPSRGGGNTAGSVPLEPPGPTYCGGVECSAPRACCLATSLCFDPATESESCPRPDPGQGDPDARGAPCASNAHCSTGETCMTDGLTLCQSTTGHCIPIASCPGSGYAVCGCDGNSYPNIETACRSGTTGSYFSHWGGGRCGQTIDANGGEGRSPRLVTLCGHDGHCGNDERCCALTGGCYPVSDPDRCRIPPEGTRNPCTADDQCLEGYEFCAGPGCSGPGGCLQAERQREECGVRFEPVCGCNGVTYTSVACAYSEGVRVESEGECAGAE